MNNVEKKQIVEENVQMLRARRMLLDIREGANLLHEEKSFHNIYESLSDHEIDVLADVDFPLFTLDISPVEMRDVVPVSHNYAKQRESDRIIYEANMLYLLNRWQKSITKNPDEIRFSTKRTQYEALKKLTVMQLQSLSNRGRSVSKISLNPKTLESLIDNPKLSREERNCRIVTG